jgi:FkbM family methyltransferase
MLSSALDRLPGRLLAPLRHAYVEERPGTVRYWALAGALRVLQYRHIDPEIAFFTTADDPAVCFVRDDSAITRRVFWYGSRGHEKPVLDLWVDLCRHATRVLEIGANVGYFTVHGAHAAREVRYTAVEPHPRSAALLRRNVEANGLTNVTIVEAAAVGQKERDLGRLAVPAADPDSAPAGAHLLSAPGHESAARETLEVALVDAEEIFDGADLLKLDAEGSEFDILHALEPHLRQLRPTIVVEVLPNMHDLRALLADLVGSAGYNAWAISDRRVRPLTASGLVTEDLIHIYHTRDVLLRAERRVLRQPLRNRQSDTFGPE